MRDKKCEFSVCHFESGEGPGNKVASKIVGSSLAFFISHFYLASRIFFISHLAFFYLASRIFYLASHIFISHLAFFISHLPLGIFFLLETSRTSNVPYRLPYERQTRQFFMQSTVLTWVDRHVTSSMFLTSEPVSMMILRSLGFSGRGLSLELLVFLKQNYLKFKWHREILLWPCCTWTTAYRWILPRSLMKRLGLTDWGGTAGRTFCHMHAAGGFCWSCRHRTVQRVEDIVDVELDCAGTYRLAMWNNSRLSLAV